MNFKIKFFIKLVKCYIYINKNDNIKNNINEIIKNIGIYVTNITPSASPVFSSLSCLHIQNPRKKVIIEEIIIENSILYGYNINVINKLPKINNNIF